MRFVLALGLLITLSVSADAATWHHFRTRDHMLSRSVLQSWGYEPPPPPAVYYDETPSYNDPSKFGGGTALGIDP